MVEREALAAALDDEKRITDPDFDDYTIEVNSANFAAIYQVATSYLAQLPEKCEHGKTKPHHTEPDGFGFSADCPGKVYPAELVERIKKALYDHPLTASVAVLDALNETP